MVRPQSVLRAFLATRRSHRPRLQVGGEPEKSVSVGGAVERVGRIEHPNVEADQAVLREQETSKARESRRPPQQNANNCNQRPPGATARPARSCFAALLLRCLLRPFFALLLCCFGCFGCFAAFAPVAPLRIFNRAVCCAVQNLRGWQSSAPLRLWLTRLDRDLAGALLQGLWRERSLQAHQASKQLPRVPLSSWFLRRLHELFTTRRTNTRMLRRERLLSSRLPRCRSIASAHHI